VKPRTKIVMLAIGMVVMLSLIILLVTSLFNSPGELSLDQLQANVAKHSVKEVLFSDDGQSLTTTLSDGQIYNVTYPPSYQDTLTTVLVNAHVTTRADAPGFWAKYHSLILWLGFFLVVFSTATGFVFVKTKLFAMTKRVFTADIGVRSFSKIIGADEQVERVKQLVDYLENPEQFEAAGVKVDRGWILYGPPGTGKTLLAWTIAQEAGAAFYRYSGADFAAKWVGESEGRAKELFRAARAAARKGPVVVVIDEIDEVGAKRNHNGGGGDKAQAGTLTQILTEMDELLTSKYHVIIIGTTNRMDALDPALIRPGRLTEKMAMPAPDKRARQLMLEMYAAKLTNLAKDEIDFARLARLAFGCTGATIASIANNAGLLALQSGPDTPVTMAHFEHAIRNVLLGNRRKQVDSEAERRLVARHEAGHAIAGLVAGADVFEVEHVTIVPHGDSGGSTWFSSEDNSMPSKRDLKAHLVKDMGSVAAEKLMGEDCLSTGPAHDLEEATKLARQAICEFGMGSFSDKIPYKTWYNDPRADSIAIEVEEWLREAEDRAKQILIEYKDLFDALLARLLDAETVSGSELRQLAAKHGIMTTV